MTGVEWGESSQGVAAQSHAARERLDALLRLCVQRGASDLHLSADRPAYIRTQGELVPIDDQTISAEELQVMTDELARSINTGPLMSTGSVDGSCTASDGTRFRFNIYRRQSMFAVALRRLEDRFRTLAELGLPEALYDVCSLSGGLVVVAGPTGSGKSTTLATLVDRVNQTRASHIITIEDPIEYLHKPIKALVNQRQIGTDARSFDDALVAALRQDPDVILVGEVRELATIRTAITAAETGHLVLTTVHAGDCIGAIERLVAVFPADEQPGVRRQLSLVLRWVVAQHLLVMDGPQAQRQEPGKPRRVVTSEVLRNTQAVANLIATAKSHQILSSMESGTTLGMQTLEQDLARLWNGGLISEATAVARARNPQLVRERAQAHRQRFSPDSRGGSH
jgi:twitching motility protein PilT